WERRSRLPRRQRRGSHPGGNTGSGELSWADDLRACPPVWRYSFRQHSPWLLKRSGASRRRPGALRALAAKTGRLAAGADRREGKGPSLCLQGDQKMRSYYNILSAYETSNAVSDCFSSVSTGFCGAQYWRASRDALAEHSKTHHKIRTDTLP